jgi:DNA repair protein RecO (recombination protein O)
MAAEKATALVLRTTDWSETSRIATLWTREFGKVRVLAKGGRRLRSNFESALDLLTLCSIVLLRKSSGGLDLLTEARVIRRFPRLTTDLAALYAAYYVAELLSEGTQDHDPHPRLFDSAVELLQALGGAEVEESERAVRVGLRVLRFEALFLEELGFLPVLGGCAGCGAAITAADRAIFSVEAGGLVCVRCQLRHRDRQPLSPAALAGLRDLAAPGDEWRQVNAETELRRILGQYVSYRLGRRLRMLSYLEGLSGNPAKGS